MQLIINPNGIAATITNIPGLDLGAISGIVAMKGDRVAQYSPLITELLRPEVITMVSVSADAAGKTSLTISLSPTVKQGRPDFQMSDGQQRTLFSLASSIVNTAGGQGTPLLHTKEILRDFTPQQLPDLSDRPQVAKDLFKVCEGVLKPMAERHGGQCEIAGAGQSDLAKTPLNSNELRFLDPNKTQIVTSVFAFGACSGCEAFALTYGQSPKEINKRLAEMGSPFQVRNVVRQDISSQGLGTVFVRGRRPA